jgi:hypothetical protein
VHGAPAISRTRFPRDLSAVATVSPCRSGTAMDHGQFQPLPPSERCTVASMRNSGRVPEDWRHDHSRQRHHHPSPPCTDRSPAPARGARSCHGPDVRRSRRRVRDLHQPWPRRGRHRPQRGGHSRRSWYRLGWWRRVRGVHEPWPDRACATSKGRRAGSRVPVARPAAARRWPSGPSGVPAPSAWRSPGFLREAQSPGRSPRPSSTPRGAAQLSSAQMSVVLPWTDWTTKFPAASTV